MIDDRDVGVILDLLRPYLAQQIADAVAETTRLGRIPVLQPATVVDTNTASGVIDVIPDGGDSGATVPAATLIGIPEFGSRVMLQYEPPAGVFVVGYIGPRRQPHVATGRWQRVAGQAINSTVLTAMSFDTEAFDSDSFIGTIPGSTFTVPSNRSGRYLFTGMAAFNAAPTGRGLVQLAASSYTQTVRSNFDGSTGEDRAGVTAMFKLNDGDTVQLQVYQISAGPLNVTGYMEAVRLLD